MQRHRRARPLGFTLIEVIVVVAVVGILAAIAVPAYRESVAKGARANAAGELLAAQQWMERFYSENFRYDRNRSGTAVTDPSQFPAQFSQSPRPGEGGARYDIALRAPVQTQSYTIVATRRAPGPQAGDACGDFTIDQTGRRGLENWNTTTYASVTAAIAACWRQ